MPLTILPTAGQSLNVTRDPIRNNFNTIENAFIVDHIDYGIADQGKHAHVTFPRQAAALVTGPTEVGLYALLSAYSGQTELSYRKQNGGAAYEFTTSVFAAPGFARLPCGILLKWDRVTPMGPGLDHCIFPVGAGIPAFNNIFTIIVTPMYTNVATDGNLYVRFADIDAGWGGFSVWGSERTTLTPASCRYAYLAIGE
jgi:hypothetical protein